MIKALKINNQETNYLIDDNGEIYNQKTKKQLKKSIKSQYYSVKLTISGKKKDYLIHRLVAETFLINPKHLPQVHHKDNNSLNNKVSNLEWVSVAENMSHKKDIKKERQKQYPITEDIKNSPDWAQFEGTSYYFCKDGRGANLKTGKYLNPTCHTNGYLRFGLFINGERKWFSAHKLIYQVFHPDQIIPDDMQINHIDGNKYNNALANLECISRQDNMLHSYYVLKQNTIQVKQYDIKNNFIKSYLSLSQAAEETGFLVSGISMAINGKMKTYKGFIWKKE